VGGTELLILLVILLLLFGAKRFSNMARGLGRVVKGTQRTAEDTKSELLPEEVNEAHRAIQVFKSEAYGEEQDKSRRKS
jgi:sec-independent protein translocase protein TatA